MDCLSLIGVALSGATDILKLGCDSITLILCHEQLKLYWCLPVVPCSSYHLFCCSHKLPIEWYSYCVGGSGICMLSRKYLKR